MINVDLRSVEVVQNVPLVTITTDALAEETLMLFPVQSTSVALVLFSEVTGVVSAN
jgi:hypothetical protein